MSGFGSPAALCSGPRPGAGAGVAGRGRLLFRLAPATLLVSGLLYGLSGVTDAPQAGAANPAWASTPQWSQVLDDNGSPI